jgi:hypothetical protein
MPRLGLRVNVALVGSGLLLGLPITVVAAEGMYGSHYAQAACIGTGQGGYQMIVPAPQIFASIPRSTGFVVGNQHNQLAAYKVNIFYSPDGANWQFSTTSSWRAGWVGDGVNAPLPPSSWYDYDSGQWVSDSLTWNLNSRGYYRAAIMFYWFADNVSDAGSDYVWADHFDYTTTNLAALQYCTVA